MFFSRDNFSNHKETVQFMVQYVQGEAIGIYLPVVTYFRKKTFSRFFLIHLLFISVLCGQLFKRMPIFKQ